MRTATGRLPVGQALLRFDAREGHDMSQMRSGSAPEELIQVGGTFDAVAAWALRRRLRALPADAHVVVDFTGVKEFLDLGVAVVAPGMLERGRPRVTVRGLRTHQYRMFRYFGVDLASAVSDAPDATEADGLDAVR